MTESIHFPRRYIFVSLNGYWPGYDYYRYYNYGIYPYVWYTTAQSPYNASEPYPATGSSHTDNPYTYGTNEYYGFANITEPAKETAVDKLFEQGVDAFTAGNYSRASEFFLEAKNNAPDDIILPFAYIQSLFAEEKYAQAARQLRDTINRQPVGSEWVFYPRGLYLDDDVLNKQIEKLAGNAENSSDLQLLAGYQFLGIHQFEESLDVLNKAQAGDKFNQIAVGKLMYILNSLKANYQTVSAGSQYIR